MNKQAKLRDKALEAIQKYLKSFGWEEIPIESKYDTLYMWHDSLTGSVYKTDIAFTIQMDRELVKLVMQN